MRILSHLAGELIMSNLNFCIGYDLRMDWLQQKVWNSAPLENQTLVESSVVLSADALVWPRPSLGPETGFGNFTNPFGLIRQFHQLETLYSGICEKVAIRKIALTCDKSIVIGLEDQWGPGWFDDTEGVRFLTENDWLLLGYDVVDPHGLTSGLSGCGFKSENKVKLSNIFSKYINEYGLLSSITIAQQFSNIRSLQIKDHSPFVPMALYLSELRR